MIYLFPAKMIQCLLIALGLCSCTVAINQVDTHGTAEDVVDTTQTNDPEVSPTISLPIKPL